jgi:LuxR family maltose regulon positive regulatory protein
LSEPSTDWAAGDAAPSVTCEPLSTPPAFDAHVERNYDGREEASAVSATASSPSELVLVATKLHVPQVRSGTVSREGLVRRLVDGGARKLALLCAPPGWGKTVLLGEWRASDSRAFAWLSLDRNDDDPVRFWRYVIAALAAAAPAVGETALTALPAAGAGLVDVVVAPLINDLAAVSKQLVLVLDDYHLVHAEAIHQSVAFLLRNLPQNVQLAIATRADPPLPLASLRAAGEITEIRAEELRFSEAEANALLNDSLRLGLDASDVELLRARTEGWAAGLQLAALSVQAQQDRRAFIDAFAGDDRQIGDYLHEVLDDQPPPLRDFLLRTSILERMCAPLCDVLTEAGDSAARLEEAEHSNLFLVPLDSRREWYRYHHLFRELLRHELARTHPDLVDELHRKAAAWHRDEGEIDEAIAHAAAARDFGEAGELIAQHWRRVVYHLGQVETVIRWLDLLPREFVLSDPRLCLARGWIAVLHGRHEEVREYLVAAESSTTAPGPLYAIASSLESALAQLHTTHALSCGDVAHAMEAARRTLELEPDPESLARAVANINLGALLYFAGEVEEADAVLEAGLRRVREEHWRTEAVIAGLAYRAAIHVDAGRVPQAERIATEAEAVIESWERGEGTRAAPGSQARNPVERPLLWTRGMSPRLSYVAGKLLEHRGDLEAADAAFARAAALGRRGGRRLDLAQALISLARLKRRQREHEAARALAREARQVLDTCPDPGVLSEFLRKTERALQLQTSPTAETVLPADLDLSERELGVLRLLASELSQREIGSELYISLNTVKGHVRSIFRKLGVATRAEAVARGRELGLL